MTPAIRVDGLSKCYRVETGGRADGSGRFLDWFRQPLHKLRHGASHSLHTEEFWALRDVSFEVARGEVLGVVGRNGAGKSTLLKILSRVACPTRGKAELEGRVGALLEVGTGFHPDLTGRENVFLNGVILGMSRREIRARFDDIVDFAGVEKFIDTPVKRYSSGMRVRLGFGVAAFLQPEILIVDEVLAVGDVEFQKRCLGKMNEVASSGRTVLFVSHNLHALAQLTSRCVLLEAGRLVADGSTDEVLEQYLRLAGAGATGEITADMHRFQKGLRFLSARFVDATGQALVSPPNLTPLEIEIELQVDEPLESLILTAGVNTLDEMPLVRVSSDPRLFRGETIEPGTYRVALELSLPLKPGPYSLVLRADKALRYEAILATVPRALLFELAESRRLGTEAGAKPYREPLIPLEARWRQVEVNKALSY